MRLLKYEFVGLYLLVNKFKDISDYEFTEFCKSCEKEEHFKFYVYYIQGWWIPHIDQLMDQGKLTQGSKEIEIERWGTCQYSGYLDNQGRAFGMGEATNKDGTKLTGTFKDDK